MGRGLLLFSLVLTTIMGSVPRWADATEVERKAELKVVAFVNDYRAGKGLGALVENTIMRREARRHSRYMAEHQTLSHDHLAERKQTIADEDDGIVATKICENTGNTAQPNPGPAAKAIVKAWIAAGGALKKCLINRLGFTSQSVGVGVKLVDHVWWITLLAAHDSTT